MGELLCPFLLFLLLRFHAQVFCVALACKETEVAAATDENMLLVPENQWSVWEEITWRVKLSSRKLYSLVTLSSSDGVVDLNTASPLGRRIAFHPGNLSLQIELVNKSDSGVYSMDVTSASGSLDTTCFRVSVFDRVRQPNLTALSAHLQLGRCNVTLSCQVPAADRVTYSWSRGASSSPAREDQQLPGHQSQLQLEITAGSNDTFYHCNASNAASWGTATIDVKPLCIFPATVKGVSSAPSGAVRDLASRTGTAPLWARPQQPCPALAGDLQSPGPPLLSAACSCPDAASEGPQPRHRPTAPPGSDPLPCSAPASSLSYCQAKGLILLLVLGALITGTVAVHIVAGKQPKWDRAGHRPRRPCSPLGETAWAGHWPAAVMGFLSQANCNQRSSQWVCRGPSPSTGAQSPMLGPSTADTWVSWSRGSPHGCFIPYPAGPADSSTNGRTQEYSYLMDPRMAPKLQELPLSTICTDWCCWVWGDPRGPGPRSCPSEDTSPVPRAWGVVPRS